jgi:hypothetical protein
VTDILCANRITINSIRVYLTGTRCCGIVLHLCLWTTDRIVFVFVFGVSGVLELASRRSIKMMLMMMMYAVVII